MDCGRSSSLTPPQRDKNKFNSHGKRIKSGQYLLQSVCKGDLLCKEDEAHLHPAPTQATFMGGDSKSWQRVVDLPSALKGALVLWFVLPHHTPANVAAVGQEG